MDPYETFNKNHERQKKSGRQKKKKNGRSRTRAIKKKVTNMVDINPTRSITTLNVNGLNVPVKRRRSSEWTKNQDPTNSSKVLYL